MQVLPHNYDYKFQISIQNIDAVSGVLWRQLRGKASGQNAQNPNFDPRHYTRKMSLGIEMQISNIVN